MKEKDKSNNNINDDKFNVMIIMTVAALIVLIMDMLYIVFNYGPTGIEFKSTLIISYIIVVNIMFLIWGITNSSKISVGITVIIAALISIVNQIKMAFMGEPIYISDVGHLNNMREIFSIVDDTLFSTIKKYIPLIIIGIIILGIFIYKFKSSHVYSKISCWPKRILMIFLPLIVLLLLFVPNKTTKKIYLNLFYNANNRKNYDWIVSKAGYYYRHGVIGGIYGQFLECNIHEPDGYNEENLKDILEGAIENKENDKKLGMPNIIVILSESFWDISKLKEVEFDKELTPNLNKLKEEGISFEMLSPSYGGTTANVEMEFLTGFNLAYYNNGYLPYLQLYKNNKITPNIINELKNNGYTTKIISSSGENLFNAKAVYETFGVDKVEFLENVGDEHKKGYYVSDKYVTDKIIHELGSNKGRFFCMALTMQAHMPYELKKYSNYDINITKSNLNKEMEETVLAYAQGIYDADKQLGILNEYIQTLDEPTIVIFFGDHLPYLKTATGKDVMDELEYFNTSDELVNNYRKYNTEALLIANFDIMDNTRKYMSPDLIMPYILNNMDIDLSPYYVWLAKTSQILPSYNRMVAISYDGDVCETQEISGKVKQHYLLREQLQYMLFIK